MDPYTDVHWLSGKQQKKKTLVGRTRTHHGGDKKPYWNFDCRGQAYRRGDIVQFTVMEENEDEEPTFCGRGKFSVEEFVKGCKRKGRRFKLGLKIKIPLYNRDEHIGNLTVQASYRRGQGEMTQVDPSMFELPVNRVGVAGGTAPFFKLLLSADHSDYWIGKDLSHALDEVDFYEGLFRLREEADAKYSNDVSAGAPPSGFEPLMEFMLEYLGCVKVTEAGTTNPCQLLVLRNMCDGCKRIRLLDLKIGEKTSAAGWQGKSRLRALKQDMLDSVTNSAAEGFRAEGFDGEPPTFASMDPLLDFSGLGARVGKKTIKRVRRIMLQRMSGQEIFKHFLDVHQMPRDGDDGGKFTSVVSPSEHVEGMFVHMVQKLVCLASGLRLVPVPQKWIGSSVALAFDISELRSRETFEASALAKVYIFDWGRSELLSARGFKSLPKAAQQDREVFWKRYIASIDRLAWNAVRAYLHRFGNTDQWKEVEATVFDFDSLTDNDFIGRVVIPCAETKLGEVQLLDREGKPVKNSSGQKSLLKYSLGEFRTYPPEGWHLRGAWVLRIVSATNLPSTPTTPDPFVRLTARSQDGTLRYSQETCTIPNSYNPTWDEEFEIPLAKKTDTGTLHLQEALNRAVPELGDGLLVPQLPPDDTNDDAENLAFQLWIDYFNKKLKCSGPSEP